MSTALEVRGLWKRYGSAVAVRDVSLTVERGQMYGLLGPNGSGKTTTLSCALGLLAPSSGKCTVLGEPATKLHRTRGKVGCVFDVPALLRGHTIEQNLHYQGRLRGHKGGRQMDEALERVGLKGFRKRRAGGLSLGQEKRLAIAGAIMGSPELVVLDEPLSGLDPMGVRGMLGMLEELKSDGQTLIISSHRLHEMQEILSHAAVILDGDLVKEAPLEEYLGQPGTWRIEVKNADAAEKALAGIGKLMPAPDRAADGSSGKESGGAWRVEAPGVPGETLSSALAEAGAGLLHFTQERMGLQASFEALVDQQRRARAAADSKVGGAA